MSVEIKIPEIGESISEVVIGEWLKAEGDHVERDEEVVIVESDKATVEIPAPEGGRLAKILKHSGKTAAVGEAIGRLESEAPGTPEAKETENAGKTETEQKPAERRNAAELKEAESRERTADTEPHKVQADETGETPLEPKATAKSETTATYGEAKESQAMAPRPKIVTRKEDSDRRSVDGEQADVEQSVSRPVRRREREEKPVPMSPIRRRIAERLVQAQQTTAFLSTFNEIDMSGVNAIRREYQGEFQKKHNIKLGLMSFFVKAAIEALKLIPEVNAEIRGQDIVYRDYYDIGVAVGGGKGLVVPVLRNSERMSFREIEQAVQEFARKAEKNQLKPDDLDGGTFTISNGGIYGSLLSTPIINAPQSGILAMHAIQDRPVARDGQVAIRPMMYVALTYDHRIVDGREAVTFLKRIKECVEAPSRILLEI